MYYNYAISGILLLGRSNVLSLKNRQADRHRDTDTERQTETEKDREREILCLSVRLPVCFLIYKVLNNKNHYFCRIQIGKYIYR